MKSKTLKGLLNEWVSLGKLQQSDKDFLVSLAENEAITVANNRYGPLPQNSRHLPISSLQGNVRKWRQTYQMELAQQLEWRYHDLRMGKVLFYDLGGGKEKTISLRLLSGKFST